MSIFSFSGYKIWITGATKGIGLAIAKEFVNSEAILILSARTRESYEPIMDEFKSRKNVMLMTCDVSSSIQVNATFEKIIESYGGVDILINNAGIGIFKSIEDTTEVDFDSMINTNLKGVFNCVKAVLPGMKERRKGWIINLISVAAFEVFENCAGYSASKAGVLMMDKVIRKEVRKHGIKVIDLIPGATDTDIWNEDTRSESARRMLKPDDVARACVQAIQLSLKDNMMVEELLIRPQLGDL